MEDPLPETNIQEVQLSKQCKLSDIETSQISVIETSQNVVEIRKDNKEM